MTAHVLAFSLFLPGHVAGDDTPSRYSNTMQHCPACASKLVLLLDKFGEIRRSSGSRNGHFDQPLSPGPPAYGSPLTATSPVGCGEKGWGQSPAMCGSHAYLSQLSSSGSLEPPVSQSTEVSVGEYTHAHNSVAEKRRMIRGGWYCSHCGVHIKPGSNGTSSTPSKSRKSGDDDDYDVWESQVQEDFCAFLSSIRDNFASRELQLQNFQVDLVRREKSLLNKEELFRERMAKLGRAEDIMQQKVKRLMLYKEAMMAQIKSQVSKARAYEEKVMSKRVSMVTRWTQTDISTAWHYGVSGDEPGEQEQEQEQEQEPTQEWDGEGRWPQPEVDLSSARAELRGGATSPREVRSYGRLDDAPDEHPATRRPESRGGPSRDDVRPMTSCRGNLVESRAPPPTRADSRRPMSLDRRPARVGQSAIPRARSASDRGETPGVPPGVQRVVQRSHRPLRSPNATQVRFEALPKRQVEPPAESNQFSYLDESDEVFEGGESPAVWRDRQPPQNYQEHSHTSRHRNPSEATPRVTGNYQTRAAAKEPTRPAYRSVSANSPGETSSRRPVSIGRYNATPKHNDLTSAARSMTSPNSYEFLGADTLMLSTNGEQKTPDSGYLSPPESRASPQERFRSLSASGQRSAPEERQPRSSGAPRRTVESCLRQPRSQAESLRQSKSVGYVREKPALRAPTSYARPGRPVSALEQSRSSSRLPTTKKAGVEPRPTWSSRPRRGSARSASEPPNERCAPGCYGGAPGGGGGDVVDDDDQRPAAVSRSFFKAVHDSFLDAGADRYDDRWPAADAVQSPPSEPASWAVSAAETAMYSVPPSWQHADGGGGCTDEANDRNSDYITSLMQRELVRSCTPTQPKKYFDLAPTYKRWLYDHPQRTDANTAATGALSPRDAQSRPTKSPSRLPHRIATYRRMAAHSEKATVH